MAIWIHFIMDIVCLYTCVFALKELEELLRLKYFLASEQMYLLQQ